MWHRVDLDASARGPGWQLLDDHERSRAARFRFPLDRDRFIAARVALRLALSEVTDTAPERITIILGTNGKPMLPPDAGWVFNLSHSAGLCLIAIARAERIGAVGIDVECMRPIDDWRLLARECFSDEEYRWLDAAGKVGRMRTFLRFWTRKEACLKAIGTGLTVPAGSFTTGLGADTATVSIDAADKATVEVRTLFEEDASTAALAWCPPVVRTTVPCNRQQSLSRTGAGAADEPGCSMIGAPTL